MSQNESARPATADLRYHVTKATNPSDPVGCLLLLVGLPLLLFSAYLLYARVDIEGFLKVSVIGMLLVAAGLFVTPRLFGPSREHINKAVGAYRDKGQARDDNAARVMQRLRDGERTPPFWLFLRPFALENELLTVSTLDDDLKGAPELIRYEEESFHDPKRQPVDLFDNLQLGFADTTAADFMAVGRRPHQLHGSIGFVETEDVVWQRDVQLLIAHARVVVCMPWDSAGVIWETENIVHDALTKTLFVMPPSYHAIESVKSFGVLPMPWFYTQKRVDSDDYEKRWIAATAPLANAGFAIPQYNWHGMIFGYGIKQELFVLRVPVHSREYSRCYAHIAARFNIS